MSDNREPIVRIGGLLRCCTQTIVQMYDEGALKQVEGELLTCRWCHRQSMVFHDGAYQWTGPKEDVSNDR